MATTTLYPSCTQCCPGGSGTCSCCLTPNVYQFTISIVGLFNGTCTGCSAFPNFVPPASPPFPSCTFYGAWVNYGPGAYTCAGIPMYTYAQVLVTCGADGGGAYIIYLCEFHATPTSSPPGAATPATMVVSYSRKIYGSSCAGAKTLDIVGAAPAGCTWPATITITGS